MSHQWYTMWMVLLFSYSAHTDQCWLKTMQSFRPGTVVHDRLPTTATQIDAMRVVAPQSRHATPRCSRMVLSCMILDSNSHVSHYFFLCAARARGRSVSDLTWRPEREREAVVENARAVWFIAVETDILLYSAPPKRRHAGSLGTTVSSVG